MKNGKKFLYILVVLIISAISNLVFAEGVVESFQGINNAGEIIDNIDFIDVRSEGKNYWAKNAIYKMAGLGIIKGYGQKDYMPKEKITKAEAIALIYRALGKETDAQKELEKFRQGTIPEVSDRNITAIWAEGYLLLAKKDGLISDTDFYQAIMPESFQKTEKNFFFQNDFVERQEVAVWIAKAFKLDPEYDQISIFNNFVDWKQTDYENIPYVEAVLKEKIMNGDNGYFYPTRYIKRDEITQLVSNMEDKIYEVNSLKKKYGFVENIFVSDNKKVNNDLSAKTIMLRADDGSLNTIVLSTLKESLNSKTEEINNHNNISYENEVIVNKNGVLGKSNLLLKYDRLLIVYDGNNNIKYIESSSGPDYESRVYGSIENIDFKNNTLEFRDVNNNVKLYVMSNGIIVSANNVGTSISDLEVGDKAYIIVRNGIITRIESSDTIYNPNPNPNEGQNDVRGIVAEVNSNLNYITLYGPQGQKDEENLTTYNFAPKITVRKDGFDSNVKDIDVGDNAYLKINDEGKIELINVNSNYYQTFADVFAISDEYIVTKLENGNLKQYTLNNDIPIYKNGGLVSKDIILAGDKLKLTLSGNEDAEKIKEINIDPDYHLISKIYRGQVYDISNNNIVIYNAFVLNKTEWNNESQKGFIKIPLDTLVELYENGEKIAIGDAYSKYVNNNVYIATYSDYGSSEKAIKVFSIDGLEKLYDDSVIYHYKSNKILELENSSDEIIYNDATIVTRYGRMTVGNNIKNSEPVYIVGVRNPESEEFIASVVQVEEKPSVIGVDIYRGTISTIDEGKGFTVSSFSKLNKYSWDFVNIPKNFDINNNTIISTTLGIVNNRDFKDYSTTNYKDKVVYIAAKGSTALEVSDAVFGVYNIRGEIHNIANSSGTTISLQDASLLDNSTGVWSSIGEGVISAYPSSIIIKNGNLSDVEDLKIGDKIRAIKSDNLNNGDGFIILVEA